MRASDRLYILGLTGGISSGKNLVSDELRSLGVTVIDADEISRQLTAPGGALLGPIRQRFGDQVFSDDALDRRALAGIVFSSEGERRALEAILHPAVQSQMLDGIAAAQRRGEPLVVLSAPLLFETGTDALCREVWVVSPDIETQIRRLMARDRLDRAQALSRIESQMSKSERDQRADLIVKNEGSPEDTRREIRRLHKELLRRIDQSKG